MRCANPNCRKRVHPGSDHCPRHHQPPEFGPLFPALYPGTCRACNQRFTTGQPIRMWNSATLPKPATLHNGCAQWITDTPPPAGPTCQTPGCGNHPYPKWDHCYLHRLASKRGQLVRSASGASGAD